MSSLSRHTICQKRFVNIVNPTLCKLTWLAFDIVHQNCNLIYVMRTISFGPSDMASWNNQEFSVPSGLESSFDYVRFPLTGRMLLHRLTQYCKWRNSER